MMRLLKEKDWRVHFGDKKYLRKQKAVQRQVNDYDCGHR